MINYSSFSPVKKEKIVKGVNSTLKFTFLAIILFLMYFPLLIIIIQSFNLNVEGTYFTGFTFKWYGELFKDEDVMKAIGVTISISIISTIVATILGTLFAIGINSLNKKKRQKMILVNNIPVLNADIVTGISLFFIFKAIGVLIGNEFILGYSTLLIAHIFFSLPYVVLSVLPKLNELDKNLYDAALDLGCSPASALRKVIIPSILTGVLTGAMLAFTMSFDDFVISYMVSGEEIKNFSVWIYTIQRQSGRANAWPKGYAYNSIITLLTLTGLIMYNIIVNKRNKKRKES
jgi:spermidine/putrescine transport system permease protein